MKKFVCPHAVIRPFLMDKKDDEVETVESMFPRGFNYSIGVSYKDCTGCGLCSEVCPGKKGAKALEMAPLMEHEQDQKLWDYCIKNVTSKQHLIDTS